MNEIVISIIIVNYKVNKELLICISSIYKSKPKVIFEIIVVDNSENNSLEKEINEKYPEINYIINDHNTGFGSGINLGSQYTKGRYLFILNPDTKFESGNLSDILDLFNKTKKVGVVAPLLVNEKNKPYELQGTKELTPKMAFFSLSFISKIFQRNRVYKDYYNLGWDKSKTKEVDVVPGTAFIIKKDLFEKLGGFDEKFFLYFEEFDLCKRIKKLGYKNYICPKVKLFHKWGASTKKYPLSKKQFTKSRFYYFRKNYGLLKSIPLEIFLSINKWWVILSLVLLVATFLRIDRLNELMVFFPDMGVFYLSAKEMLTNETIPLVSIETSHPWIRHGPLWTYVLAIILWFSNFNPVVPAYFIAILGVITVFLFYYVLKKIFDENVAILGSILFATSPLIVLNSRIGYHTSPLPFLVILLFYATFRIVKGSKWALPFVTLLLGTLYNHEITSFVYFIAVFLILSFGFIKKETWFRKLINLKIILLSIITFIIPMIPFILYDIGNGQYNQTLRFLVWVGYRIAKFPLSLVSDKFVSPSSGPSTISQFYAYYQDLIFAFSGFVSFLILTITIIFVISYLYKNIKFNKKYKFNFRYNISANYALIFVFLFIGLTGLLTHRIPIEADMLLISPFVITFTVLAVYWMTKNKFYIAFAVIGIIALGNIYYLISTEYRTNIGNNKIGTINKKIEASEKIIDLTDNKSYNLIGKGELSNFPSFTMPYEYLLWWKGNPPTKTEVDNKILVWEKDDEILILQIE